MAGVYLHIPYCKLKCHYCDFHFSTKTDTVEQMLQAMCNEIQLRKNYLENEVVETIYFGGGTPAYLNPEQLNLLLSELRNTYSISNDVEITVECNPDDMTPEKLEKLKSIGANRLSVGIQSFDDEVLKFMNRAHDSKQIYKGIQFAKSAGFTNITVDLIYGIPGQNRVYWKNQLEKFLELDVQHLSAYCLTIEQKTVFGTLVEKGSLIPVSDENALDDFEELIVFSEEQKFDQYEISNFAKTGFESKHNSSYWLGKNYLGIGPSAHSYNQLERSWNVANNHQYIAALQKNTPFNTTEILTLENKCNDYLLTRLRTKWGIDLNDLTFIGTDRMEKMQSKLSKLVSMNLVQKKDQVYVLSNQGKFRADGIAAGLFI